MSAKPAEPEAVTEVIDLGPDEQGTAPGRVQAAWIRATDPRSPALVYAGVIAMAAGFALTAYTWGRVAGLLSVPLQLPYIASGGLTAIGFVALGAAMVTMGTARRDAARRHERLDELAATLRGIREALEQR